MAYGAKSPDGRQFVKNDRIREEFASTVAYSDIFMELAHDANKAAEFVNSIMPKTRTETGQNITALPGQAPVAGVISPTA